MPMEVITLILSIVAILIVINQKTRIDKLENEIKRYKQREQSVSPKPIEPLLKPRTESKFVHQESVHQKTSIKDIRPVTVKQTTRKTKEVKNSKSLLNIFLESGTGIFGVIILVMGLAFLGVYSALSMTAFPRYILFIIYSGLLYGGGYVVKRKFNWNRLSLWLRSASGAIFLFSCVGSAGIPGLQWIDNPFSGLFIVVAGILVNILLAKQSGLEIITSIHMLLALISLSIAPATISTLVVAGTVCGYNIYLSSKKRWDINLIITSSMFHIFHFYWYIRDPEVGSIISLMIMLIISLLTLLFHYRELFSVKTFMKVPFLTHFLTWCYLGVSIFLYYELIPLKIIIFSLFSIGVLILTKRAKKLEINWLLITDTLVANLFMILAIVSLMEFDRGQYSIFYIISLESFIFMVVVLKEKQKILTRIAYPLTLISLLVTLFINMDDDPVIIISKIILIIITSAFYVWCIKKVTLYRETDQFYKKLISYFPSLATFICFIQWDLWDYPLFIPISTALLLAPIFYFSLKESYRGVYRLTLILMGVMMVSGLMESDLNIPFILILGYLIYKKERVLIPLLMLELSLVISSLDHLYSISPYLPELCWLVMIVLQLLLPKFLKVEKLNALKILNYMLFFIFVTSHLIFVEEETMFRYIIYGISGVIFLYWIISHPKTPILEVSILYLILLIIIEFDSNLYSVISISISILFLLLSRFKLPRLSLYSILFSWFSVISLAFHSWRDKELILGILTAVIFTLYLILLHKTGEIRADYLFKTLSNRIKSNLYPIIYYPFFISMALFILFSFKPEVITLFFVVESLIIFILSMALQEQHFKVISMIALGASLLRLTFVDLAQSGTLVRAIVFIGVGIILVVMNMIYLKFKPLESS